MRSVVITGVSTGIGHAAAKELVSKGFQVFGSVRKPDDGAVLKSELGAQFVPLIFDVTDRGAVASAADQVRDALGGEPLFGLVNNAGLAVPGPLMHTDPDSFEYQLAVNTVAPVTVTNAFLPLLGARLPVSDRPGRIVNISSVAGRMTTAFNGQYAASKHALEALSDAYRRELMIYGIDVVVIQPGPVKTAIWDKIDRSQLEHYRKTDYGPALDRLLAELEKRVSSALPVERISELVLKALTHPKPASRYVATPGYLTNWLLPRLLPDRIVDSIMARRLGLRRGGH